MVPLSEPTKKEVKMKKVLKIVGVAALIVVIGVATLGTVALAQGEEGSTSPFDLRGRFRTAIAGILGITVEEYDAAVEQAKGQVADEAVAEGWLTEEQAERLQSRMEQMPRGGMRGMVPFGKMDRGVMGRDTSLTSIAADALGMTLDELQAAMQGGESIADLAAERNVDTQTIVDAYVADLSESLAQHVADGKMTQQQMDDALEQAAAQATEQLDEAWQDAGRMGRGMDRGGSRGFRPGTKAPPEADPETSGTVDTSGLSGL